MRADSIRPNVMGTARFGEWNQRPVTVLGFPRGEAVTMKYRHLGTDILSWLMRGGERLVNECGLMSGMCLRFRHLTGIFETIRYRCPSSVFFVNRFRSADWQKIQLSNFGMIATGNHNFERFAALCNTLGGSQGAENLRFYHSTNGSVPPASGGCYPPYGYAAYHCGNLQVRILKLHLSENGAGESKIGGRQRKKLAAETSPHLKEMFTPYGIMISRQKLLWKSTKQKGTKRERVWKMQKRMKISWKIQQRVDFRGCLW